jgi:non-specific serine/threonine protein kinase
LLTASDILAPHLTPGGHLLAVPEDDAPLPLLADEIRPRLGSSFALGAGHGLLHLGTAEIGRILPPAWAWWRDFAARYVTALCATPEGGEIAVVTPVASDFDALIADAPPMTGGEYLTADVLTTLWGEINTAWHQELGRGSKTAVLTSHGRAESVRAVTRNFSIRR